MAIQTRTGVERLEEDVRETVRFIANPIQRQFIESRAEADLWSCRMGEGKSAGLCWASFFHAKENPGARHVFFRDTYVNLQRTTQAEFFKWFPPGRVGTWHEAKKLWKWNVDGLGKAEVLWMGADSEDDISRLQSLSIGGAFFDEPAPGSDSGGIPHSIFGTAATRLRDGGQGTNWYALKLAENSPDETHWTYIEFVDPGQPVHDDPIPPDQERGFKLHRGSPENLLHLPRGYYERLERRMTAMGRPDLVRRFVHGDFGFQQSGQPVTPQYREDLHGYDYLMPENNTDLLLLWDFGAGTGTTCTVTQPRKDGHWDVLASWNEPGSGVKQLIASHVRPYLNTDANGLYYWHSGDPAGSSRDASDSTQNSVRMIRDELGGRWRNGALKLADGIDPLRWALSQLLPDGEPMVRVSKKDAIIVHRSLRGGWKYRTQGSGVVAQTPTKDSNSHPGDTMRYGASVLYPHATMRSAMRIDAGTPGLKPFAASRRWSDPRPGPGPGKPGHRGVQLPKEARKL